jgi:hypothetical protein
MVPAPEFRRLHLYVRDGPIGRCRSWPHVHHFGFSPSSPRMSAEPKPRDSLSCPAHLSIVELAWWWEHLGAPRQANNPLRAQAAERSF